MHGPLLGLALALAFLLGCAPQTYEPQGTPLLLHRAEAAFERRDYRAAAGLYSEFLAHRPPPDTLAQAHYKLALAYFRAGAYESARTSLDELRERFPQGEWLQVWTLYGDIDAALDRRVGALQWWERAWTSADPEGRAELRKRIVRVVAELNEEERLHVRALATTEVLAEALAVPPQPVKPAAARPDAGRGAPSPYRGPRVGVILPLSGRYAQFGQSSLNGVELVLPASEGRTSVEDVGDDEAHAVAAFARLASDPSVVAVIGPLRSQFAAAVARAAEKSGIVLLPLSQNEEIGGSPVVVQTAMTRSHQAERLAEYAVGTRGLRHFVILHPADSYGERMASAFRAAATVAGGRVLGILDYDVDELDFEPLIDRLEGIQDASRLDAVLVPDAAERVALLGPQILERLPYVQLLGTSQWNDARVLEGVAAAMEGAVFVDGFFAHSRRPATRRFVEQFQRRYGRTPGLLEAQAYDAAALAESVLRRAPASREQARSWLRNYGVFVGAAGDVEIWEGNVRRDLFLLQLRNGWVEEVTLPGPVAAGRGVTSRPYQSAMTAVSMLSHSTPSRPLLPCLRGRP